MLHDANDGIVIPIPKSFKLNRILLKGLQNMLIVQNPAFELDNTMPFISTEHFRFLVYQVDRLLLGNKHDVLPINNI